VGMSSATALAWLPRIVAPNCYSAEFADARGDFVGIGSVADDITEANQALPAPVRGGESGIQS